MLRCNVSDGFLNQASNYWQVYPNFVLECLYNIGSLKKWCLYKISITNIPPPNAQRLLRPGPRKPQKKWAKWYAWMLQQHKPTLDSNIMSFQETWCQLCMFNVPCFCCCHLHVFFTAKASGQPLLWYSSKHLVAIHHVLPGARWREPADAALPIHCPHSSHIDIEVLFMEI